MKNMKTVKKRISISRTIGKNRLSGRQFFYIRAADDGGDRFFLSVLCRSFSKDTMGYCHIIIRVFMLSFHFFGLIHDAVFVKQGPFSVSTLFCKS